MSEYRHGETLIEGPLLVIGPSVRVDPPAELRGRVRQAAPGTAPADADLWNNSVSIWLDQANNNLVVKVKYSNGTVKSGTVALT